MAVSAATIHVGDIGTVIRLTIVDQDNRAVSLVGYTQLKLDIKKPGGVMTKTLVFVNAGTDGKVQYVSVAGDFDVPGTYTFQAFVELPSGQWSSTKDTKQVEANLVSR